MERYLETDVLIYSLSFLQARDIASCGAVSRSMLRVSSHDSLWKRLLKEDLGISSMDTNPPLSEPSSKDSSPSSWRNTYLNWRRCFFGYPISYVKRMRLFWAKFEAWGMKYAPQITSSLNYPCSQSQIDSAERSLESGHSGHKIPLCLKLLYRFHNGQSIPFAKTPRNSTMFSIGWGMFGGTAFYDSFSCVRMLTIEEAMLFSGELSGVGREEYREGHQCVYSHRSGHRPLVPDHSPMTIFAVDMNPHGEIHKGYFVSRDSDSRDGSAAAEILKGDGGAVYTNTKYFDSFIPCHPCHSGEINSYLLLWLEEYIRRLDEGVYLYQPVDLTDPRRQRSQLNMISHFPCKPLFNNGPNDPSPGENIGATTMVTRGVEVVACPAFIPEQSNPWKGLFFWSYSIRMRLLADSPDRPVGMSSCQLTHRHWTIYEPPTAQEQLAGENQEGKTQQVNGEAVIGLYPLLSTDVSQLNPADNPLIPQSNWPFSYQSCSNAESYPGQFRGFMDFVPGSMDRPTGPSFEVFLAPFALSVPEFLY